MNATQFQANIERDRRPSMLIRQTTFASLPEKALYCYREGTLANIYRKEKDRGVIVASAQPDNPAMAVGVKAKTHPDATVLTPSI
jgi:hypothetical protein